MSEDTLFEVKPPAPERHPAGGVRFVCPECWQSVTVYIPAAAICDRCHLPMKRLDPETEAAAPAAVPRPGACPKLDTGTA